MNAIERTPAVIEADLYEVLDRWAKTEAAIWNEQGLGTLAYIEADYIQYEVHNKAMTALENSLILIKQEHRTLLKELVDYGIANANPEIKSSWMTPLYDVRSEQ